MENKDLRIVHLERENELLKKEVVYLKELLARAQEQKSHSEDRLGQAKDAAKKGLDISKDLFSVTKSVFGKAKETFKEEWEKQKFVEKQQPHQTMFSDRNATEFTNELLNETLSKEDIAELSSKLADAEPKTETSVSNENTLLSSLLKEEDLVIAATIKQANSTLANQIFDALSVERKNNVTAILSELEEVSEELKEQTKKYVHNDSNE